MIFKEFSRTIQSDTINGWIYRITIEGDFIYAKRVKATDQLWSHGFLCQIYDVNKNIFVPQSLIDTKSIKFYGVDLDVVKEKIFKSS